MIRINKNIVSVNGNDFEYAIKGTNSPAIILINGAGGPIEGWLKAWEKTGDGNVVFAFNRLGVGNSSKPKEPQSGKVMVNDLKELLLKLNIKPPYLIVGHSFGGFVAHLFAKTYSSEVSGIVFLESSMIKDVLNESKIMRFPDSNRLSEVDRVLTTVEQIQDLGVFPNIPLVVIAGGRPAFGWIVPNRIKEARLNNQKELAALSQRGRVVIAEKSGHFPQLTEPLLVIDEVNRLLHELVSD